MRVAALAGGVGASKLLLGLYHIMNPAGLTAIVNTGDDLWMHGLEISPDLDIVTYTLAGIINPATGWGIRGDTFHTLSMLGDYGQPRWFNLGDFDLATHILRTEKLRAGSTLSEIADLVRRSLGVRSRILPMSDQPVRTVIRTPRRSLSFQEYLVKYRAAPRVRGIRFAGSDMARPAPGVLAALRSARAIVICPSNPLISIGPILAVPGIRETLSRFRAKTIAVCPLVKGKSLKGPSDRMLAQMGFESSALGVARLYKTFCGTFIIDPADAGQRSAIESLSMRVVICPSVMRTLRDKKNLARRVLEASSSQFR
jgi:LPPG:FO 2-phospho-L-lactate transferase